MKALKIILIILVVIVGGYAIWMATLPSEYRVERTEVIDAEPEMVYATVSDFKTWKDWSKWHKMDPDMEMTFGDKSAGEGATYSWKSENKDVGSGTQSITEAVPPESMKTHIAFEGMGESDGYWKFEPVEEDKTRVTWGFTGEFPFFMRSMGLMMDKSVGNDFEEGLANLKTKVEAMPKAAKVEIAMVDMEAQPYYGIKHELNMADLNSQFFADNYEQIGTYLGDDAQNMLMPPFAIFYEWDEENQRTVVEPGMAVQSAKPGNDKVKKGMTHGGKALKAVHTGGYDTGAEHEAIGQYMEENGYDFPEGVGAWEVYVTDPGSEPDTAKWVTEIYYPVAMKDETMDPSKEK